MNQTKLNIVQLFNKLLKRNSKGILGSIFLLFLFHSTSPLSHAQSLDTGLMTPSVRVSLDTLNKNYKSKIKNSLPDTLGNHLLNDSLYKSLVKQQILENDSMIKSAIKSLVEPKFDQEGTVSIEAFATNAQNPLQLNERQYIRVEANTTTTVMGLPFNTGFYYTTEDQSLYNTNRVYFSFDASLYKQRLTEAYQQQQEALLRKHKIRNYNINQLSAQEEKLKQELSKLKSQIPDTSLLNDELNKQKQLAEQKAMAEEEKRATQFKNKGDSIYQAYRNALIDSIQNKKLLALDSFENKRNHTYSNYQDTALINKYQRTQAQLEKIQKQRERLEALQQNDTLNKLIQFASNPSGAKSELMDNAKGKMKLFMATDRFDIGAINPVYSEFTTMGTLLRGGEWQLSNDRYFGTISLGRTTVNLPSLFTRTQPQFGRNFGFIQAGMGKKEGSYVAINLMGAKDSDKDHNSTDSFAIANPPIQNTVVSLEGKYTLNNRWIAEGEIAQSSYDYIQQDNETLVTLNDVPIDGRLRRPNLAYKIKSTYKSKSNTEISASLRQVNPGFKTVGNIFLRNNMMEYEFNLRQAFLKKRIQLNAFYKENKDNVFEVLETTNRMKGYGGTLNISLPKYPILTLGYMPYEQGNNHPDSLLQTNNHFSMLFANMSYMKRIKAWNLVSTASFTQSEMQIRNSEIFTTSNMIQATLMAQFKNKWQLAISYANQSTNPGIDTLNSQSTSIQWMYNVSRKLRIGSQANGLQFKSGGYKYEGGLSLDWQVTKGSMLRIEGNLGQLNNIWGLENSAMRNAMIRWMISF